MIPNTLNYMIAGYIVIIIGIGGYVLTLIVRSVNIKRKFERLSEQDKVNS